MNRDMKAANILLLVLGVLSLALLSLPLSGKVGVFRACATYLLNPVPYYGGEAVTRLRGLPANAMRMIEGDVELHAARLMLKETYYLQAQLEALRHENERLHLALGLAQVPRQDVRWARVMQRDAQNWHRSITVTAGSRDGVVLNSPVLGLAGTVLGVVGRVTEVGLKTSKVLLLTDDLSSVAAYLPVKGWEGLIQGQGSFKLRMNYLPDRATLEVETNVYTSATSATFGADLLIGKITKVYDRDQFLAFQSVEVTPAVFAASLKEVMILLPVPAVRS